jgi:aldose 1-epimerase
VSGARDTFALRSTSGLEATVAAFGATLVRLRAPDRNGRLGDVVLGFDDLRSYEGPHPYLGALVGRFANRIAGARFALDGAAAALAANDGRHCLHGGPVGFDRRCWQGEAIDESAVELRLVSPDGDQGFPGRLEVRARYRLDGAALRLELRATCDAPTVVSLASHAYWNLEDGGATPILDHELTVAAGRYLPVDAEGIPTGALLPVAGTPFDFRAPRAIGARHGELDAARGGYDHCFALDAAGDGSRVAARLAAPRSGRTLTVRTTLPGLQLYDGSCFDGRLVLRGGVATPRHGAVALETEHFPNAPNEPAFPSARLDPGSVYEHSTVYELGLA